MPVDIFKIDTPSTRPTYFGKNPLPKSMDRIFSSPNRPDRLWGSPDLLSNEYRGVKQPGREANHSPPASAEVKKIWIYTSTPPYAFMA
jgi:hypothetical protein